MKTNYLRIFTILLAAPLFATVGNHLSTDSLPALQFHAYAEEISPEEREAELEGFGDETDVEGFGNEMEFEEEEDSLEDALDIDLDEIVAASTSRSAFTFGGFVKEDIAYGFAYEDPEWAKFKSSVNLTFDYTISETWKSKLNVNGFYDSVYRHRGRDEFTDETLETYESEFEIRDLYVDGSFPRQTYFKFGRQVIAWGVSSSNQINDMVNPRYQRELGMVDLEDARLPVVASKFTKVFGTFDIRLVAVHEIRGNKMAVEGSDFDPYVSTRGGVVAIEEEEVPNSEVKNTEFAVRLSKLFNGGDVALLYSDSYDDSPYLDFHAATKLPSKAQLTLTPKHRRMQSFGISGSLASGSWLYKAELAKKYNLAKGRKDIVAQFATLPPGVYDEDSQAIETWKEKDEAQAVVGIEYSGISDLKITVEGAARRIENHEQSLLSRKDSATYYLMFDYTALNDSLNAKLMATYLSHDDGRLLRGNVEYDFIDDLTGTLGAIFYEADKKEARLYPYRKNDKVFASIKSSF